MAGRKAPKPEYRVAAERTGELISVVCNQAAKQTGVALSTWRCPERREPGVNAGYSR